MYSRCRFKEQPHKLSCCALPNFVCIVYEIDEFRFFPFVPSFVRGVQHTLDKVKPYSRQFYLNIIIVIYCSCFLVSKIYVIWPCIYGYENELEFHYFFFSDFDDTSSIRAQGSSLDTVMCGNWKCSSIVDFTIYYKLPHTKYIDTIAFLCLVQTNDTHTHTRTHNRIRNRKIIYSNRNLFRVGE